MEGRLAEVVRIQVRDLGGENELEGVDAYGVLVLALGLVEEPAEQVVAYGQAQAGVGGRVQVVELRQAVPQGLDVGARQLEVARRAQSAVDEREELEPGLDVEADLGGEVEVGLLCCGRRWLSRRGKWAD